MPPDDNKMYAEVNIAKAFEPSGGSLKGLRSKVFFRLFLIALIPLIALSLYFRSHFSNTLEKSSTLQLETIALSHGEDIDIFVKRKVIALNSIVQGGLIGLPPTKKEIEKLHKVLQSIDETILDVGVFDINGNHIHYSGPFEFLEGKNYNSEFWFKTLSVSESSFFISDVYLGYRGNPHFTVAVRTVSEGTQWFIRMTIDPSAFLKIVDDVRQVEGAHAYIINNRGVFQSVSEKIGDPLTISPIRALLTGKVPSIIKIDNRKYLVANYKMQSVNWYLIVQQPLEVAYGPIARLDIVTILIIMIGIVFIVLASLYATKTLVRRYARSEKSRGELINQLIQAGKLSTMGEMAAGVAHEINNPLAIIMSETGLMKDYLNPSLGGEFNRVEYLERLASIEEETNRCRNIIHKLLGFARRTAATISECNLNETITQTIDMIGHELSLENIDIDLDLDEDLPTIMTDGEAMKQVLLNLIKNAADAIGKDGRISVSSHAGRDQISLIVTDTGCGIPEENISHLFVPFYTTKEVGKGTGLGLSITHGIVTSLGGKINVSSKLRKGTSFEIVIPRKRKVEGAS